MLICFTFTVQINMYKFKNRRSFEPCRLINSVNIEMLYSSASSSQKHIQLVLKRTQDGNYDICVKKHVKVADPKNEDVL